MISLVTAVLVIVLCGLLYRYLIGPSKYFDERGIEHTKGWPIFGNMGPVLFQREFVADTLRRYYNKYRGLKYFGFLHMVKPLIVIRDVDLVLSITVKNFDHFTDHMGFVNPEVDPLMGKNLFSLRGDKWRNMRRLLSPAFTSSKMKSMFTLIFDCADRFSDFVAKESKGGKVYDLQDIFKRYTNDVVASTSFGVAIDSMKDRNNQFFMMGKTVNIATSINALKFLLLNNFPTICDFFKIRIFRKSTEQFFTSLISETVRMRDEKGLSRPDMVQLMMESRDENGQRLSIDEMTYQAFIFFLGGFDTSALLLCLAANIIAGRPDIQARVLEDVKIVTRKIENGESAYDAIRDMAYTDAVLSETQRMYPVVAFLDRECTKEFELPPAGPGRKPVTLKPGDKLWFLPAGYHFDPEFFPEPEEFRPERFLEMKNPPAVYMPFGIGPRICIGNRFALMSIKAALYFILKRCTIELSAKSVWPIKLSTKTLQPVPVNGYYLKFKPRQEANEPVANGVK